MSAFQVKGKSGGVDHQPNLLDQIGEAWNPLMGGQRAASPRVPNKAQAPKSRPSPSLEETASLSASNTAPTTKKHAAQPSAPRKDAARSSDSGKVSIAARPPARSVGIQAQPSAQSIAVPLRKYDMELLNIAGARALFGAATRDLHNSTDRLSKAGNVKVQPSAQSILDGLKTLDVTSAQRQLETVWAHYQQVTGRTVSQPPKAVIVSTTAQFNAISPETKTDQAYGVYLPDRRTVIIDEQGVLKEAKALGLSPTAVRTSVFTHELAHAFTRDMVLATQAAANGAQGADIATALNSVIFRSFASDARGDRKASNMSLRQVLIEGAADYLPAKAFGPSVITARSYATSRRATASIIAAVGRGTYEKAIIYNDTDALKRVIRACMQVASAHNVAADADRLAQGILEVKTVQALAPIGVSWNQTTQPKISARLQAEILFYRNFVSEGDKSKGYVDLQFVHAFRAELKVRGSDLDDLDVSDQTRTEAMRAAWSKLQAP